MSYVPKNLLVTGGCGFIGSNFINNYFEKYQNVFIINLDAMYYCANEQNVDAKIRESKRYKFVKGDINSYDLLMIILQYHEIDTVIHFAAQSHVQNSFFDSMNFTQDNIMGTHCLLESCRKYGKIQRFIHVSTDEVYGESSNFINELQKTEESILIPTNPYAATKAGAELIAQSYIHSFKMPIIITRGNNVYGKNQYPEKLIPKFIKQLMQGQKVTIQGDGSAIRAFLHVNDVVNAFDIILKFGEIGQIYNIGSNVNCEFSVLQIAQKLILCIKNDDDYEKYISYIDDRPFNDKRYYISNQKLINLGWSIQINFDDGLKELIKEYTTL